MLMLSNFPGRYALVWRETVRTYTDMMKTEGWASQEEVFIPVLQGYLFKVCLSFHNFLREN
jgi:hypothetical protein